MLGESYQQDDRVSIKQEDTSLIVTNENLGRMSRYTFDGKETTNPGPGDSKVKSKAHWDNQSLVVESTTTIPASQNGNNSNGGGDFKVDSKQTWSLNPEGTLRMENLVKGPRGNITTTVTFAKANS